MGDLSSGFGLVGPFDDFDEAAEWADEFPHEKSWMMTLQEPDKYVDASTI